MLCYFGEDIINFSMEIHMVAGYTHKEDSQIFCSQTHLLTILMGMKIFTLLVLE
jgi:hypothetical protein